MDVVRPSAAQEQAGEPSRLDPRLQPTPDYGTLGTGSDFSSPPADGANPRRKLFSGRAIIHLCAAIGGITAALLVSSAGGMGAVWGKLNGVSSPPQNRIETSASLSDSELDRQQPQKQAEILLERAVSHSNGSSNQVAEQIESRVDAWRGRLQWDAQLGDLTTAALNSNDRDVQNSAVEVQLAAYGITKQESSVDALIRRANSSNESQKVWAFWTLGLLANRGIETDRVVNELAAHLKVSQGASGGDSRGNSRGDSEEARCWAVEGLALIGTTATIVPLLEAMHNDPAASVRERAACGLAQSGMLSHEQRLIAVLRLINYSADSALDAQTHGWAFQALTDITGQHLPNDSAAWREWYQANSGVNWKIFAGFLFPQFDIGIQERKNDSFLRPKINIARV
jgi:hypothetical protein